MRAARRTRRAHIAGPANFCVNVTHLGVKCIAAQWQVPAGRLRGYLKKKWQGVSMWNVKPAVAFHPPPLLTGVAICQQRADGEQDF